VTIRALAATTDLPGLGDLSKPDGTDPKGRGSTISSSGVDFPISSAHLFDLGARTVAETDPVDPDERLD
jgi:hypothetical protein